MYVPETGIFINDFPPKVTYSNNLTGFRSPSYRGGLDPFVGSTVKMEGTYEKYLKLKTKTRVCFQNVRIVKAIPYLEKSVTDEIVAGHLWVYCSNNISDMKLKAGEKCLLKGFVERYQDTHGRVNIGVRTISIERSG